MPESVGWEHSPKTKYDTRTFPVIRSNGSMVTILIVTNNFMTGLNITYSLIYRRIKKLCSNVYKLKDIWTQTETPLTADPCLQIYDTWTCLLIKIQQQA